MVGDDHSATSTVNENRINTCTNRVLRVPCDELRDPRFGLDAVSPDHYGIFTTRRAGKQAPVSQPESAGEKVKPPADEGQCHRGTGATEKGATGEIAEYTSEPPIVVHGSPRRSGEEEDPLQLTLFSNQNAFLTRPNFIFHSEFLKFCTSSR
jgi:hypothetical protein